MNYYNEVDPHAVQWLKNLIAAGHLPPGDVDSRSIAEVQPDDIRHYHQRHWFAGIGGWPYALKLAGYDGPCDTGSCPCQPFSAAGRQKGTDDDRHLWPEWFRLIRALRPPVIFGEQVASKAALNWFDAVSTDLEGAGYTVGAADLCAASVGAPHIRQRLYFVAYAGERGRGVIRQARLHDRGQPGHDAAGRSAAVGVGPVADADSRARGQGCTHGAGSDQRSAALEGPRPGSGSGAGGLGDAESIGRERWQDNLDEGWRERPLGQAGETGPVGDTTSPRPPRRAHVAGDHGQELETAQRAGDDAGVVADAGSERVRDQGCRTDAGAPRGVQGEGLQRERLRSDVGDAGSGGGFWDDATWIPCLDGKARPTEPSTAPLASWTTEGMGRSRSGMLKGYGNAIVTPLAAAFISAAIDAVTDSDYGAADANNGVEAQVDLEPVGDPT